MSALVSVITPTFNRAYILGTAIDSVRAQTYQNWELIVIDDGSTDGTKKLIETYNDSRIRYVFQENKGQAAARNRGLDMAKGEWITFLDSDNEFYPQFLEKALKMLAENPGKLCLLPKGDRTQELYDEKGNLVESVDAPQHPPEGTDIAREIFMRSFIFDPNAFLHHRSITDEGIRFDEECRYMEDWDYAMTIAEKHPDAFIYCPEALYHYHQRYGGDGIVSNMSYGGNAEAFEYMYTKHKDDTLMQGQTWYPAKAEKWRKIQADFEKGLVPPPHLYQFKDRWQHET